MQVCMRARVHVQVCVCERACACVRARTSERSLVGIHEREWTTVCARVCVSSVRA